MQQDITYYHVLFFNFLVLYKPSTHGSVSFFFFFFPASVYLFLIAALSPRNVSDPSVTAKGTLGIRDFPSRPVCVRLLLCASVCC